MKWGLVIILCAALALPVRKLIVHTPYLQIQKVRWYARMHETFPLGEVTDFDWDAAYYDGANYGAGELMKENYKLDFSIKIKIFIAG